MLKPYLNIGVTECGTDEAGRGCLSGGVCAAAVILPFDFKDSELNDSKQLSEKKRQRLRATIESNAVAYAVAFATNEEIDRLNILHASILAMNRAVKQLSVRPEFLLVDGNRFYTDTGIAFKTIVKGDATFMSIAAASVLAKTYRDAAMEELDRLYPQYNWRKNKGYPTKDHRQAIEKYGITPYHRKSFTLLKEATLF
ncbi:MAG: ribonuclease HII [Bacteroidales bacterium]|nr:ribonuclease HII [Bacteroidales bacterium]